MSDLGHRIRSRRQELGLTLQQLADMALCGKSYLSEIENNRRAAAPSETLLRRIEQALGFERGFLIERRHFQDAPPEFRKRIQGLEQDQKLARQLAELIKRDGLDGAHSSGELRKLVERFAGDDPPQLMPLPVQVPIINKVAAGYPTEFTDLGYPARIADEYISTPDLYDPQAFAARVVGDSMAPDYRAGDVVVFSPERDTPDGADCFVRLDRDNETTFKRVYFEGEDGDERIRLQPINPAYPPRTVSREEVAGLYAAAYVVRAVDSARR